MFNLTPVVRVLLLLNVAVLLAQQGGLLPDSVYALHQFNSPVFRPWQLLTHMFMHGGWGHLFSNMLSLFFFGSALEQHWGGKRFVAFYLICGIGAASIYNGIRGWESHQMTQAETAFVQRPTDIGFMRFTETYGGGFDPQYEAVAVALHDNPDKPEYLQAARQIVSTLAEYIRDNSRMVGASGAVFAILFAFGYLFPNQRMYIFPLPIGIEAKYFVFLYGAYELWKGVQRAAGDNVAHFAHLGGMLFAFILLKYWEKRD